MDEIMVSIYCITYNHVGIIEKCLEGFIMQKTDFKYEVWIHDDKSTDGTTEILKKYEKIYPDIIRVIYETENQYSRGVKLWDIMKPYMQGKYTAICEGDDYWTDPYKLQKQVDFMENNPETVLCVHGAKLVFFNSDNSKYIPKHPNYSSYISLGQIIVWGGGWFPTCSFLYRTKYTFVPDRWGDGLPGDFSRILQFSLYGKIYYMHDEMAVKVQAYPGSWSDRHKDAELMIKHKQNIITSMKMFDDDTDYKYHTAVKEKINKTLYEIECEIKGNYKALFIDREFKEIFNNLPVRKKVKSIIIVYFKPIYTLYRKILKA